MRPAAIQLTMVLSHWVKHQLSEAIDLVAWAESRLQSVSGSIGIFSSTADDPISDKGQVLGVPVGST